MMELFRWWLSLEILGLVGLPIVAWLFPGLKDKGISLARVTGLVLVSYPVWLISHWGDFFGTGLIVCCLCLVGLLSLACLLKDWNRWLETLKNPRELLVSEAVFHVVFLLLALIRAYNPEIEGMWKGGGSEKFMDLNFVNSILNSGQFPPQDNWLAGFPINYYYYGYYLAALLVKLTGVLPHVGYNLMVVSVYALAIQGMWGLLRNLGCGWSWALLGTFLAFFATNLKAGWLGFYPPAAGVNFIPWESSRVINLDTDRTINEFPWFTYLWGDLHGHLSALPFQLAILGFTLGALISTASNGKAAPTTGFFRQCLGALFLSLTYGCLVVTNAWDLPAFAIILLASLIPARTFTGNGKAFLIALGMMILVVILIGLSRIGVPLPLVTLGIFLMGASCLFLSRGYPEIWFGGVLSLRFAAIIAVFSLFFSPFFNTFVPPTAGYNLVPWQMKSPLPLLLLIFGAPFAILLLPFGTRLVECIKEVFGKDAIQTPLALQGESPESEAHLSTRQLTNLPYKLILVVLLIVWAIAVLVLRSKIGSISSALTPVFLLTLLFLAVSWALRLWMQNSNPLPAGEGLGITERYVALLLILALGLILGCEFVAVKDFYGTDSMRLNTVFKFHMQAWIIMPIVVAFLADRFSSKLKALVIQNPMMAGPRLLMRGALILMVIVSVGWTGLGTWNLLYSKCSGFENRPTLDGLAYALPERNLSERPVGGRDMSGDDAHAILFLLDLQRFEPDPNRLVLESPGDPYSIFGRISAFSGIPTLVAVPNHEGIWNRGKTDAHTAMTQRQREAETIYRTPDFRKAKELLEKYKVTHVVWGTAEQNKYGDSAGRKFKKYMQELKSFGNTTIYAGYQDIPIDVAPPLQEIPPQPLVNIRVIEDPAHPLNQPRGITVGMDGISYVCNSKAGQVDCFSPEGTWLRTIGTPGQTPNTGQLSPEYSGVGGVAVDQGGTVYVADTWNHRIVVFGPDGAYLRELKADFWGPRNLTLFRNQLVVADTGKHRLVVLGLEGNLIREVGTKGDGSGEFLEPVGLASVNDLLAVADVGNHRVQIFGPELAPQSEFEVLGWNDQVGTEAYLAVDSAGTIWLTDSGQNRIQHFTTDGKLLGIFGPTTQPPGGILASKGLAFFNGHLYLSDFGKNRVVIFPLVN